jgi:hypothetical protein
MNRNFRFREYDFLSSLSLTSLTSLTSLVNEMYFSFVIGSTEIEPSNAMAISLMIKCES